MLMDQKECRRHLCEGTAGTWSLSNPSRAPCKPLITSRCLHSGSRSSFCSQVEAQPENRLVGRWWADSDPTVRPDSLHITQMNGPALIVDLPECTEPTVFTAHVCIDDSCASDIMARNGRPLPTCILHMWMCWSTIPKGGSIVPISNCSMITFLDALRYRVSKLPFQSSPLCPNDLSVTSNSGAKLHTDQDKNTSVHLLS